MAVLSMTRHLLRHMPYESLLDEATKWAKRMEVGGFTDAERTYLYVLFEETMARAKEPRLKENCEVALKVIHLL